MPTSDEARAQNVRTAIIVVATYTALAFGYGFALAAWWVMAWIR